MLFRRRFRNGRGFDALVVLLESGFAGFRGLDDRSLVLGLEHHVGLEGFPDLGLQFQNRELQQANRLLQLGRHRELLTEF